MSPQTRLAAALNRITARTRVLDIRARDEELAEHTGSRAARQERLTERAERLEKVADELEAI